MTIDFRQGDYRAVLRDVKADLILTSPPYNIGSKSPRRDGLRKYGQYDPKSYGAIRDYPDSLPESKYQDQQAAFLLWAADHLADDGILVYNHKPRRRDKRMISPAEWFLREEVRDRLELMEEIVWDRGSTHNHSSGLMWPTTERLYVFKHTGARYRFVNSQGLPQRSDVWRIPAPRRSNGHACPFPLDLATAAIQAWSAPGHLVCDPYAGSGTTAVAAMQLGRRFIGSELQEKYWRQAMSALFQQGDNWHDLARVTVKIPAEHKTTAANA